MNHPSLPSWATIVTAVDSNGEEIKRIQFSPADAYPEALSALGFPSIDKGPTQYQLEVARRCVQERLQEIVEQDFKLMVLMGSRGIHMHITNAPEFRLSKFAPGEGAERGAMEFRRYLQTYKNNLPKN